MINIIKKQNAVYWLLMLVCAMAAGITVLSPLPAGMVDITPMNIPKPLLILANFALILLFYGLLGLLGRYFARKNSWPDIFEEGEGLKNLFYRPLFLGIICGALIIISSTIFQYFHSLPDLPHPPFPYSVSASFAAGIGEEILTRLFLMSFWAWALNYIFKKFNRKILADWAAVVIAALVFGASHLVGPVYTFGYSSVSQLPVIFIFEMLLLNGVIGVLAGREMIKFGFIAAVGVHFWTDITWHVIYGLF